MKFYLFLFILYSVLLVGCANFNNDEQMRSDPLEHINRIMYNFNYEILDPYLIRPVAVAWRYYIPQPIRIGLNNFTSNLDEPAVMVNCLLQGSPYQSMIHFTRFFLNSVLGMGGFIDIAEMSHYKLQRAQLRRFGSTLGYYGVDYGPYVHLPFYGSFTIRDDIGNMIDTLYPVLSWLIWPLSISKWLIEGIEMRAQLLDCDSLLHQSADPYIMVRETYFQHHNFIAHANEFSIKKNINAKEIENELSEIDSE